MATIPPPTDHALWAGTGTHADPLGQRNDAERHKAGAALVEPMPPPAEAPVPTVTVTTTTAVREGGRWRRRIT